MLSDAKKDTVVKLLNKDSCTTQIVKYLEGEILSGRLPALSKLKPIRVLASQFNVSSTLVLAAFKELERRRLIYREERRGVFVSPMGRRPQMREVFILVFGDDPRRNQFIKQILSIMHCYGVFGKLNFLLRLVTFDAENMYDTDYTHETLKSEIARLSSSLHADCMLVVGPQFCRRDVELCLTLPVKTLFVGSFAEGDFDDLNYNRIGIASRCIESFVANAAAKSVKRTALIVPHVLQGASYFVEAFERALSLAGESGIALQLVYLKHSNSMDKQLLKASRVQAVKEALESNPGMIFLDCFSYGDFSEIFESLKLTDNSCDLYFQKSINHGTDFFPDNVHFIGESQKAQNEFSTYLTTMIEKLCDGELSNYRNDFLAANLNQII